MYWNRPALDGSGIIDTNSPRSAKQGHVFFRLTEDVRYRHVFIVNLNGTNRDIVDRFFTTDLLAAFAATDTLSFALDLPVHFGLNGFNNTTQTEFNTMSLGDLRVAAKWHIIKEKRRRPGIALIGTSTFTTGDTDKFTGFDYPVPGFEVAVGKTGRYLEVSVNLGAAFPLEQRVFDIGFDDRFLYGMGLKAPLYFINDSWAAVGQIRGYLEVSQINNTNSPVGFQAGLMKTFKNGFQITGSAGGSLNDAVGNPRLRGVLSAGWAL